MSVSAMNNADLVVVLVVEDEIFLRVGVANCLQDAGYAVVEAATGEEAIELCKSNASIDMIITDINLGGSASGWDVAECFRTVRPDMPVVYTSGKSVDPGRRVSGSVFVSKPYNHCDMLKVCQRLAA
jgi:CheY-like chemotaxis protein